MKEIRHGPARRWMRGGAFEWRWVAVRRRSMVKMEIALGVVVCGCNVVDMENRENKMIVDVTLRQSEIDVLLRPKVT